MTSASSVEGTGLRVLVACEFSGIVREAFRALGHDAWSCDLLPAEDRSTFHMTVRSHTVSATPWNTAGTFNPGTDNERQWIWAKAAPGDQSGAIVARDVRPADAALISAAPELLDCLRSVEGLAVLGDIDETTEAHGWGAWLKAARAAIAKAEGRDPLPDEQQVQK